MDGAVKTKRKEAIPALTFKEGGLFDIWLSLTPEGSRLPFKQMLLNTGEKFDSLESFFAKYF